MTLLAAPNSRGSVIGHILAESRLLLIVFALNGISYLPMLTLPWLVAAFATELGFGASRAGFVGSLLIGTIGLVAGLGALRVTSRNARSVGIAGGAIVFAALAGAWALPGARTWPLLLIVGSGCGLACAGANALVAASRDPVRLNGSMWGISVLWQIVIWWLAPLAAARSGLDGLLAVGTAAALCLLVLAIVPRWEGAQGETRQEVSEPRGVVRRELAIALCLCAIAFWARDSMVWSLVDHRSAMLGVGLGTLQWTLTGVSLIGFGGSVLAALLGLRFGRTATVFVSQLVALIVLGLVSGATTEPAYLGALLFWSGVTTFAWPYVMDLAVGIDHEGRVAALCGSMIFVASAAGPAMGGLLLDVWPTGVFVVTMALGAISLATAAIVALVLNRKQSG